jgi:Na+-driven multidrug efflux pump
MEEVVSIVAVVAAAAAADDDDNDHRRNQTEIKPGLMTLASHAFGAGNMARAGMLLQQQYLLHLVAVCLPIALLWLNAEPVLLAMGQPASISALAGEFLRWRVPALPFYALMRNLEWFMQCACCATD